MIQYPSIPGWKESPIGWPCLGFYKYDGSNLRWEWNKKRGWKFGTRRRLFDSTDEKFGPAIPMFMEKLSDVLVSKLTSEYKGLQEFVAFTEYFGPSSFAGNHVDGEEKQIVLLDVHVHKKGLIPAREFLHLFDGITNVAEVVYDGNFNRQLIEDVREGRYHLNEGMVCKGKDGRKILLSKIKTLDYLDRLKNRFGEKWETYADQQE